MLKLIFRDVFIYQGKNLFVLPLLALIVIFQMQMFGADTSISLAIIAVSLFAMLMATQLTFSCDETSKFNRFIRATPISAKTVVLSRYASCLLSAAFGVIITFVLAILTNIASAIYPPLWRSITVDVDMILICVNVSLLICAILFPWLFRFGYAKTKYPLMLFLIGAGSSIPMLVSDTANQGFGEVLSSMSTGGYLLLTILSLICFYGSIMLSTIIYKRQEV